MQNNSTHKLLNSSIKKHNRPKSASLHPSRSRFPSYVVAFSFNDTEIDKDDNQSPNIAENADSIKSKVSEQTSESTHLVINQIINDIFEKVCEIEKDNKPKNKVSDTVSVKKIRKKREEANKNLIGYIMPSNASTATILSNQNKDELIETSSKITLKKLDIAESNNNDLNKDTSSSVILLSTKNSSIENFCQINEVNMENDLKTRRPIESQSCICSDDNKLKSEIKHFEDISDIVKSKKAITVAEKLQPYKTDIINIALAQVGNQTLQVKDRIASAEKLLTENMISTDTLVNEKIDLKTTDIMETKDLVSKMFNEDNYRENSDATLVGSIISQMSSEKEKFFLASTGSSLNKTDESNYTITSCSEYCSSSNTEITEKTPILDLKDSNIIVKPNVEPTTNDVDQHNFNANNVIVAEGLHKLYPLKNKGDNLSLDKFSKKFLTKPMDVENTGIFKNITLPNEAVIKEIITERENSQKISCSEESRNFQLFPDIWEKLVTTLDLAIKKLEESLSEKILGELQMTLQKFEHYAQLLSSQETKLKQTKSDLPDLNKIEIGDSVLNNDEGMQCDLIQSHVIDNLVQNKISDDEKSERSSTTKVLNKIRVPKIFKDNFEILKAYTEPLVSKQLGDGDSVKISTEGATLSPTQTRILFRGPLRFVRENYFVLSSVPAFFFCVFLIYGFIVLLIKLW